MKVICSYCGKEFNRKPALVKRAKNPTCSKECRDKMYRKQNEDKYETRDCVVCGKSITRLKSRFDNWSVNPCCSAECRNVFVSKNLGIGKEKIKLICPYCGKLFEVHQYRLQTQKYICCSRHCAYLYKWEKNRTLHPRYNPDISNEDRIERRKLIENVWWRDSVFERDNYTCQICGQIGGKLHAHHLNGYHWDKEGRLDISNGITLCIECHKNFHKQYGQKYH